MDVPARLIGPYGIGCFGAHFLLERQILTGLILLFTLDSLSTVRLDKKSQNTCEDIQVLRGVETTTASIGRIFSYPISPFAFQGKITHYKITLSNGSALPKWLEFNHNTNTLQGLPMLEESGEYYLTLFAYGETCGQKTPTAQATFGLHVQDDVHETEIGWNGKHNIICSGPPCTRDLSVTIAGIIIEAASSLGIEERLYLICTMAEYLHLDPFLFTLAPFNKQFWNLTILAEDIRYTNPTKKHYIGLYWPVGVGVFTMFYELIQVLRHNIGSNSLSQLLGYEIVGWRVLKKEGNEKRHLGKRHKRQLMATPRPLLRPAKMEDFTYLSATVPETHSFLRPSETSSPLYKATETAIPTHMDIFLYSVINEMNLPTMDIQASLDVQSKTIASSIFQYLSSELSPSLTSTTIQFMEKSVSKTPAISEHQQSQMPQAVYSSPKTLVQKHNSTLSNLFFSIPKRKTQLPVGSSAEEILSTRPPPTYFAEETMHLVYSGPYRQLTSPSQTATSIRKHSLPFLSTQMDLRASPGFPFFHTITSVLLSYSSYQTPDIFSNYKLAPGAFMSSLFTSQQPEVLKWNVDFSLPDIMSTFDVTATSSIFANRFGWLPNATSAVQSDYSENILSSPMHSLLDISFLEYGSFSRTSNIPAIILSLLMSTPMEWTESFRYSNDAFPEEELFSLGRQDGREIKDNIAAVTMNHIDGSLEEKQPIFVYITEFNATFSRSRSLGEEFSHGMKWTSDQYSYEALFHSQIAAFYTTPSNGFLTNEVGFYDNSVIKTLVAYPDVLQLVPSHLSLDGSFGTKMNFQMAGELISKVIQQTAILSNNKVPTGNGVYVATLYHEPQGKLMMDCETNNSPRVATAIKWITATIGYRFSFSVPPSTFYDDEDGNTTQLSLEINPADGSPTGPECWLQFNSSDQTMYGYPLDNDFQYSPQEFLILATDSGGLRTSLPLTIEMLRLTTTPCHIYTVRTKNSYYSFLKNREKINLFFEKLSKYVSVSNPGNMVVLHLEPGSTVMAWYSKSFCTRTNRCGRDEIQDVLMKLGEPGRSVNPHFLKAMLPDFKIYQLGNVVYGGTCSSTAKPLNESLTSNRTLTVFQDNHSWVRNFFSALFLSMCTTIMVILVVALHYCKHRKKQFHSDSSSVHGRPFFSYVDLEMDMMKSHKPPVLEQEIPPSAQIWLPGPLQEHLNRSNRNLAASGKRPPPKYRLPPPYRMEEN
ncbi:hypothetical protein JRQ81_015684 [Phrynocephalus forsythii]|uniref:Peptidase S72 domain-containing protein n=1 Tax=Phrynocephalus forsythii TaxID=171643 RepID=A0A9Q1B1Z7_9SAUR|nr:hypothetical protein JRQ81_015684 [Phrynocephalus forsythii]